MSRVRWLRQGREARGREGLGMVEGLVGRQVGKGSWGREDMDRDK